MGLRGPECSYCHTCLMNVKPVKIDDHPALICPGCGNVYITAYVEFETLGSGDGL